MFDRLPVVAVVFAALAALIHLYIFVLESVRFRQPAAWRTFGVRNQRDAEVIGVWAFNQGFYNLFLAIGAIVGVLINRSGSPATAGAGAGMVLLATLSMLAAAIVLILTQPKLLRPAVVQGVPPLLAVAGLLFL